jgi:hypothetical protein
MIASESATGGSHEGVDDSHLLTAIAIDDIYDSIDNIVDIRVNHSRI